MSRIVAVFMVIGGLIAGAIAGTLNSTGGIANLFASQNVGADATPNDSTSAKSTATDESGSVKQAEIVRDLPSCMRSRGVDVDAIRRQGPRAPDHKTISALTICDIALNRGRLCDSRDRVSVTVSIQLYYDQRSLFKTYLDNRAHVSADAVAHASPQEQQKIAEADREAQSGPMDQEIDAAVIEMFKDGYFSLDDLKDFRAKQEISQMLGGVAGTKKACS